MSQLHMFYFPQQYYWDFRCSGIWHCARVSSHFKEMWCFHQEQLRGTGRKTEKSIFLDPSTLEDIVTDTKPVLHHQAQKPKSCSVYFANNSILSAALLAYTYWLSVSKTPVPQASQGLITIHLLMERCKVQWWSTGAGRGGGGSISFLLQKKNSCESYICNHKFCSEGGRFG